MKIIYVGPKQKTIENSTFFDYSITLFGDNKNNNISYQENNLDNILAFEYWNPDSNPKEIKVYIGGVLKHQGRINYAKYFYRCTSTLG